jgi:small-conductance mechanosensitive channel
MDRLVSSLLGWLKSGEWIAITGRVALALIIVVAALLTARLAARLLRKLRGRSGEGAPLIYIVEKLVAYGLALSGIFAGLSTLGINLTSLAVFAGAVGVGIGLGLQGIVRDFVSGLVVIFDPMLSVGDFVELSEDVRGEIIEIGPRATRVRTNDGLNVIIPNSKLIDGQVVNWTLRNSGRRIHVPFSVAYGVDKTKVQAAVLAAAKALPFTEPDTESRKTQVWLTGFGDSALNFELVVWPKPAAIRRPASMKAAYTWAIDDALRGAGIEIPFPQMDLRLRSLFGQEGDGALAALGMNGQRAQAKPPATRGRSTRNDAAEDLMADAEREAREREEQNKQDGPEA